MVKLFEKNSPFDLAMRGFTKDYIMDKTGFDVGYHNAKIKTQMQGIDRMEYKIKFVRKNYDDEHIRNILVSYANGSGKDKILALLGICGERTVSLKELFSGLEFGDEFATADKLFRQNNMKAGTIQKYGVDNVFKCRDVQETAKQTRIAKYGGAYTLSKGSSLRIKVMKTQSEHMMDASFKENVLEKRKHTMLERYGVAFPILNEHVKQKMKSTLIDRYGVDHYQKSKEGRMRAQKHMLEHGKEIAEKTRKTMLSRYGVDNYAKTEKARSDQSERMRENWKIIHSKMKQTMMKQYGVPYYSQTETFKKSMSDRMKTHAVEYRKKSIHTCLKKYGVDSYAKTEKARSDQSERMLDKEYNHRIIETKKANGTLNTSKSEKRLYEMLITVFGEDDVFTQYNADPRYPFHCDFYMKSRDLFIELNATWTHGGHWYDENNDAAKIKKWRCSDKKYYRMAETNWTKYDVNKRTTAQRNHLNYVVFWDDKLWDAKLWIAMGCPDGQDWKKEYSWLPKRELHMGPAVISEELIHLWNDNPYSDRIGNVQSNLYSNEYRYSKKLPHELTDENILQRLVSIKNDYGIV